MSRIKKKDLARGTKLSHQAVWDNNLDGVATNINRASNGDGLIQPMYQAGKTTFRLNWNIPWLGSAWTATNGIDKPYVIPFCLLPLQEFINATAVSSDDMPQIFMTEFSYGFDQRDEPAFVTDPTCGPGAGLLNRTWSQYMQSIIPLSPVITDWLGFFSNQNQGKLHYDFSQRGDLKFSILKKQMKYFDSTVTSEVTDSIYNLNVPMTAFIGKDLRFNPSLEEDLNIEFNPWDTYCLGINLPQLYDPDTSGTTTNDNLAMVNITISAKFEMRMIDRDRSHAGNAVQNQPFTLGAKTNDNVVLTSPITNGALDAEGATGLNTSLTTLDDKFKNKLNSGYNASSEQPQVEQLTQDSGYEVIAIPIWNNQFDNQVTARHAVNGLQPYCYGVGTALPGRGSTSQPMSTRVIVPVDYPFTIHHVVLAANVYTGAFNTVPAGTEWYMDNWNQYQPPVPANTIDTGVGAPNPIATDMTFKHDIGIGIGTGLRGTKYGYKEILYQDQFDLCGTNLLLDDIRMNYDSTTSVANGGLNDVLNNAAYPNVTQPDYEWRTFYLPLNGTATANPNVALGSGLYNGQTFNKATTADYFNIQDPPFFCGQDYLVREEGVAQTVPPTITSLEGTSKRIDNLAATTFRLASDQWIEVRWNVKPKTAGGVDVPWASYQGITTGPGDANESKIIHGYGGHWIYLIGKKTAVSNANWKNTNLKGGM